MEEARQLLTDHDLQGLKVLITAGPTIEYIDPVRIVTNRSTGRMGYALARAAWRRGAEVTLVTGPTHLDSPKGISMIKVKTAEEMREAVMNNYRENDVVIKAAAVSDYKPLSKAREKEKKKGIPIIVEMEPTPDILAELGKDKGDVTLVGFAAETTDHVANAMEKIKRKNLGNQEVVPLMLKEDVADRILDRIKRLRTE
jgi:phosphopantothenoylcysteine decarboxylase/phosphopantothenate--cysteine ligase